MRCPRCNTIMIKTMHFEKDKNYTNHMCPKCYTNTHPKRIHFDEFERGKRNENKN